MRHVLFLFTASILAACQPSKQYDNTYQIPATMHEDAIRNSIVHLSEDGSVPEHIARARKAIENKDFHRMPFPNSAIIDYVKKVAVVYPRASVISSMP